MPPAVKALLACVIFVSVITHYTNVFIAMVALALALLGIYAWSIKTHPDVPCTRCNGSGKHRDPIFFWAFRGCNKCLRTGRQVRWGARMFTRKGRVEHRSNVNKMKAAANKR